MKREMKRTDRQVTDPAEIDDIIQRCGICRLGLIDGDEPYVVPMNFGYKDKCVYFHGALTGRKMTLLEGSPRICVEFDLAHEMVTHGDTACKWSQKYESVIAWGKADIMSDPAEKRKAFDIIMGHYSEKKEWEYPDIIIERTHLVKVTLDRITAKKFL